MKTIAKIYISGRYGNILLLKLKMTLVLLISGMCLVSASDPPNGSTPVLQSDAPQQIEITGQVTDASTGEALPGVNIIVEGTGIGEITDDNGNYEISVPGENAVLVFSSVGYSSMSITVGNQRIINLAMTLEIQEMDELVVIGYGTVKKSDLTGSISSVRAKDIEKAAPVDVLTAIQGRAAGVFVSQNSGAPGIEPVIQIRGTGTVNAHAPIYVIDGMIMDISDVRDISSSVNFLNPADIASIEILKDASASAIYGSRGANGVILITTHKGFESGPKVTFNAQLGFAKVQELPENLGSEEFMDYVRESYANGYNSTMPDTLEEVEDAVEQYEKGYDTDWEDEVLRDRASLSQNYNLAIKGGTKDARYASSFGYYNEEGIIATNSNYKRYSFRINSDFDLGKIFRIGENLSITQANILGPFSQGFGVLRSASRTNPLYPVYKEPTDPDYRDPNDPEYDYYKYGGTPDGNPVAKNYYNLNTYTNTLTVFGNLFAEATFLKDFTFRSSIGINLSNRKMDDFKPQFHVSQQTSRTISQVTKSSFWTNGWLWENTLTYHKVLEKHDITAMLGYTSEYNKYDYMSGEKSATPSNDEEMRVLDAAISQPVLNGSYDIITMISMLGRINYFYDNRYLLTASVRRDGTSKFGPENKWGVFPSASIGWLISNESFFEGLKSSTIPTLKLRAGWGQIGNSSMSDANTNTYVSQFTSSPLLRALFDNQPHTGYFFDVIGIPDLSWETTEQFNVGLDLGLFRNALTLDADYFIKTTEDMLVKTHVPGYAGYGWEGTPWINAGTMENKGFEFLVSYKGNIGGLTYDLSVNGTSYTNTVLSTNFDSTDIWDPFSPTITTVGQPVGSLFGFVTDGIFQTQEEVDAYVHPVTGDPIQPWAQPGDFRFKDLNGDGEIGAGAEWDDKNGGDQTIIGNPHPKFIYGFTINLAYRGFDLMTHWQGVIGNEIINMYKYSFNGGPNPDRDVYINAWREENPSNSYPRNTSYDQNGNFKVSDFMVEDASYLRMKNLQLGYTLSHQFSEKLQIESCRIWIGGIDLLTFTNYSGNDPEVALRDPTTSGYDNGWIYPKSRKIVVGINVEF